MLQQSCIPFSDLHREYPGVCQPVQNVQPLRAGHGQEVRGPTPGIHASVSIHSQSYQIRTFISAPSPPLDPCLRMYTPTVLSVPL